MSKKLKVFVIEIEITQDDWWVLPNNKPLYKKGQKILIPIVTSSSYHALRKFERYDGSEYPNYTIIAVHPCDNKGLFAVDLHFEFCPNCSKNNSVTK